MAKKKYPNPLESKEEKAESRPKKDKMTELQLLSIVDNELQNSLGKMDTRLSNDRLLAMKYYHGDKVGKLAPPEAEGRSTVVSMDVSDTIEWILPSLIRIFVGGEKAVEYAPRGEEDIKLADQSTDWANYVFYTQNEGFIITHDWFKDALLQKLGIIKTWWDKSEDVTTEEYEGITLEELTIMLQDGTVEVLQQTPRAAEPVLGGLPEPVYDVKVKRTADTSHICIENVPPEEFLFSRKARTPQRMFSCAHRVLKSVSELKEAGYKNTDDLMNDDNGAEFSQEAIERQSDTNEFVQGSQFSQSQDDTMRMVWITESYLQVDWNGDGIAEWRKVVKSGKVLLSNEEIDEHPFSMLTPIKMPHKLVGRSIADLLMDIQEIKTSLQRQFIDNAYLTNNSRVYVDENAKVNIDDLLDNRVGGIVRGKGQNGVTPLITPSLSPVAFSLLEYLDKVKEERTGINDTSKGLDANTLKDSSNNNRNQLVSAAQAKVELIARIFAETGYKDLFKKILKLSGMYQKQAQTIRLTGNKFVQIDPRAWKTQYDITINVGLGNGNKDQTAAHIMNIMAIQEKAATAGLPIVSAKQIYNAAAKLVLNTGFKSADPFFIDPESEQGIQLAQAAAQKPDPNQQKLQADIAMKQADLQFKTQTTQMDNERQRQNDERDAARQQQKIEGELALEKYKIDTEHAYKMQEMQLNAELELRKHAMTSEAAAKPTVHFDSGPMEGAASALVGAASNLQNIALAGHQAHQQSMNDHAQVLSHVVESINAHHSKPKIVRMKTSQGKVLEGEISNIEG